MKNHIIFLAAAIGLLAGCAKEIVNDNTSVPEDGIKTVLQVGLTPAVKTYLGNDGTSTHKVYWSDGDQIAVNGVSSDALSGVAAETSSVNFTFNEVLSTPYNVVYPASIYDATSSTVTLPAVQAYKAGGFADGMFPMAGYTTSASSLTLNHLCAVVKVSILRATSSADTDNIASVRFSGNNGEQVSGTFSIDFQNATLSGSSTDDADKVVRVVKNLETSTSQAVEYYLVVPAGTYSNGFTVTVQDVNGHIMAKSKASSAPLVAGHLYDLPEFQFIPTGTELGVKITSAADLVQFATDYNNNVYAGLGSTLVATVTQDIVFDATSSTAFNATGGIGLKINYFGDAVDVYFDGVFNGGNHKISGLAATTPLFKATSQSGQVKDLTLDNTCSFTFTHNNASEMYACSVVGYNRGHVDNVSVAADITLEGGNITKGLALGGIVGRDVTGEVKDCVYSGNITVPDTYVVDNQKTYVGGLVGYISNPDGKVTDSDFEGTIDFAGTVASTDKNNPYLFIGGIIGSNAGTVSGCEAKATNTKEITMDNNSSYVATIQNHSRKAYHLVQGGIAGYNAGTVSGCTNGASTKNFVLANATKGGTSDDANSRYYDVGGIVGLNAEGATVSGCTNNGLFESRSTPRIQKIGGVAGYNLGTVSSSSNSNTGDIVIASATGQAPYNLRVGEVGGVIGNNGGTVSDIQNAGDITLSRTENSAKVEMKFGGVIGLNAAAIDGGAGKSISNTGNITISYNPATVTTDGLRFGGIVGSTQASVQNATNSGNVTYALSATNVMSKLYMGGVAGEVRNTANVTVSGCENSGEVYFNINAQAAAHTGDYLGGIVGFVTGEDGTTTVSNCENSGYIHINGNIATACTDLIAAGIVGKMNESGSITDCNNIGGASNAGEVYIGFSNAAHTDNYAGGILGKTVKSDLAVSGCTNSGKIWGGNGTKQNGKTFYVGGIAAYLDGVSSIDDCENNGVLLNNQFNNTVTKVGSTFEGGIAGFVLGTDSDKITISNVTNNVNSGATITGGRRGYTGGAVGYGEYVDITNATNANSYGGGSGYYIGGIAGWLVNGTISNSTYSGTAIETSQVQGAGGIVCTLDAGSTISGCSSYLNSITHGANACVDGGLAAKSIAGSTIQNCHYTGTYGICSDSNFTDGGGNVADL